MLGYTLGTLPSEEARAVAVEVDPDSRGRGCGMDGLAARQRPGCCSKVFLGLVQGVPTHSRSDRRSAPVRVPSGRAGRAS
jgi:hypothetical protein